MSSVTIQTLHLGQVGCCVWCQTLQRLYCGDMTSNDRGRQVSEVIGKRLRALRESKDYRQEDVAAAAQTLGLKWARSSVAALEAGTRSLSVEEFLLMPALVAQLGGWEEPLLLGTDRLIVSETLTLAAERLPSSAIGYLTPLMDTKSHIERNRRREEEEDLGAIPRQDGKFAYNLYAHSKNKSSAEAAVYGRIVLAIAPDAVIADWHEMTKRDYEITRTVTARLALPTEQQLYNKPMLTRAFAFALYGTSLGAERDARADRHGPYPSKRALRSARGHATREIIDELQQAIDSRWPAVQSVLDELDAVIDSPEELADWLRETEKLG